MQVYEAVVKGFETVGVDTALGGNGENTASLTLALKHSSRIRPVMTRPEQAASFMACGYATYTNRLGSASRPWVPARSTCSPSWRWHCRILSGPGHHRVRRSRLARVRRGERHLRPEPHAGLAGDVRGHDPKVVPPHRCRGHLRGAQGGGEHGFRGPPRASARPRAAQSHPSSRERGQLPRPPARHRAGAARLGAGRGDHRGAGRRTAERPPDRPARRLRSDPQSCRGSGAGFRRAIHVPLITTLDGKGVLAEPHPLAAGVFSESGHASARKHFRAADVVLALGNSLNQHATFAPVRRPRL
ncbi:thiamine pyrophosphate-binding protein [Streptomyces sp. NPDC127079]|uniref:thiamine pyrophosphate-binding protein n=1 Tax=Streptomyces sp. NPDC127079 TaxID=3347132 RepID=UPI0036623519